MIDLDTNWPSLVLCCFLLASLSGKERNQSNGFDHLKGEGSTLISPVRQITCRISYNYGNKCGLLMACKFVVKIHEWLKAQVMRQCVLKSETQATVFKSGFLQNTSKPTGGCQCLGPPHKEIFTVPVYSFTASPPISLFHLELF